jgi:hypothetical protein
MLTTTIERTPRLVAMAWPVADPSAAITGITTEPSPNSTGE